MSIIKVNFQKALIERQLRDYNINTFHLLFLIRKWLINKNIL